MAKINKQEIEEALKRLGELASTRGYQIELTLIGGALMVLLFNERQATRDVDAAIRAPSDTFKVRDAAKIVAQEHGWPEDWLNDAAKGYLVGLSDGGIVFTAPGIEVRRPSYAQLLAMKLSAWRDEVDIFDARRLLKEITGTRQQVWKKITPHLIKGSELKAQYAFEDLWETTHGNN